MVNSGGNCGKGNCFEIIFRGKFRIHNFNDIQATSGISLGDLEIAEIDEGMFEISCRASPLVLNKRKAELLAETLIRQAMFDEVRVEPLE